MSRPAFLCVRCVNCDEMVPGLVRGHVVFINDRPYCRACSRLDCPRCGHREFAFHNAMGCMVETAGAWCECGPPALEPQTLIAAGDATESR